MRRALWIWISCVLALAGCSVGIDPPEPTRMIDVAGGEYLVGGAAIGPDNKRCEQASDTRDPNNCDLTGATIESALPKLSYLSSASVVLAPYTIDQHEVTNLQYQLCVEDGACSPPEADSIGDTTYYGSAEFYDHPVVWVTREQAAAYCAYVDKRLPDEAEWEVAGRYNGGPSGAPKDFPWSTPDRLSQGAAPYVLSESDTPIEATPRPFTLWNGDTTSNDSTQIHHLAGNVSEWVAGLFDPYAYCERKLDAACMTDPDNCAACGGGDCVRSCDRNLALCKPRPASDPYVPQNAVGAQAMTRGGSYRRIACHQRLFVRRARNAESAASDLGFRCARSL